MTPKESADIDSEKLFEDDEVLFIRAKGFPAIDYCGGDYLKTNYYSYRRNTIYLIVGKGNKKSYVIFVPEYGNVSILDYDGKIWDFSEIIKDYRQIEMDVINLAGNDTPYGILRLIKSGKKIDKYDLNKVDECLANLKFNEKSPGKTMIELSFDMDEYFKFFDFQEDEWDRRILEGIFSSGYGYSRYGADIVSEDTVYEDWKEGYTLGSINQENEEMLNTIISFIAPDLIQLKEKDSEEFNKEASKLLDDNFGRQADDITNEVYNLRNEAAEDAVKQEAIRDIADYFEEWGVFRRDLFQTYFTTTSVLLALYGQVSDKTMSIKDLFKEIGYEKGGMFGYYAEAGYNTWLDSEKFNKVVKNNFEEILEKIESEPEKYESVRNYGNAVIELSKLGYKIGGTYELPNNPNKRFKIDSINKATSRIMVRELAEMRVMSKMKSFTIEEFVNYLNSPELFENLIRKVKKLL